MHNGAKHFFELYFEFLIHCNPLQGQYRVEFTTQGKPCFHYREPLFSLQGPCIHHRESCIHYREFPVRITTQGNPCSHYREWVCSVQHHSTYRNPVPKLDHQMSKS